jgi:hypothetical protein
VRRLAVCLAVLLLGALTFATPSRADIAPGGFMSSNVRWLANIPVDNPGVGGRVVTVKGHPHLYVTGMKGLSIYNLANPSLPVLMGVAPVPHYQNEDVEVSDDGSTVLISEDDGISLCAACGFLYVIDASLPRAPHVISVINALSHTVSCGDPHCDWVYASTGKTYDLRDRANPVIAPAGWADGLVFKQRAHNLNRDDAGLVTTDSVPRYILDPRTDPAHPTVINTTPVPSGDHLAYQHGNLRPRATEYVPRAPDDVDPALRPGELLLAAGETNQTKTCDGSTNGPFATWSMVNFDRGAAMQPIEVFRPLKNGNWKDSNPAINVLGCSTHWFSERHNLVAAGWYEHGTRFLHVDPSNGHITEVGYFQPVWGSASAAYWLDDTTVAVVDYARGVDILSFNRTGNLPTETQIAQSWLAKVHAAPVPAAAAEQWACHLAMAG